MPRTPAAEESRSRPDEEDRLRRVTEFFRAVEAEPYRYDFFQALRRIEALFPDKPRVGQALRPMDEPVRLAQEPSLSFAPATLSSFRPPDDELSVARMEVRFFGLLGPNGPLPLHLTEYARERLMHDNDATFARFLDVLHHRFLGLFYRAWAQAQPTVSLDRPAEDRFSSYVGALFGLGSPAVRERDAVSDLAKLFYSGLLVRHVRNADGLAALLSDFFQVPVRIEQFVGHWMSLPVNEHTRIGAANAVLGGGATLGPRVWDLQHKFRIWLGPLRLEQYETFLPGGSAIGKIIAWVRQYLSFEFDWDMRLVLGNREVPQTRLGAYGRLGWTTWIGRYRKPSDAADLVLQTEWRHFPGTASV
ncbi:MAG: type VI secretion system baseplate subunit TssG, partial [Burkholderiales bacterium]